MDAVSNIAALLVERHDLSPPVNIKALVEEFADLEYCTWPFNCDGIAILSTTGTKALVRPKVFIKTEQPYRRERFTIAHELGHVVIPWHVNAVDCKPAETQESASDESFLGIHHEAQANAFASRILVPDNFARQFSEGYVKPSDVLNTLEQADISASAGILAVRRALLPGYVFIVPDLKRPVRSEGTAYFNHLSEIRAAAIDRGVTEHQGKQIAWFQLARDLKPTSTVDSRMTAKALLCQLADSPAGRKSGESVQRIQQIVAGTIGAANRRGLNGLKSATWLGMLAYRFSLKAELVSIVREQEFYDYLSFKAREMAGELA